MGCLCRPQKERGYSHPELRQKYEHYLLLVTTRHRQLRGVEAEVVNEINALLVPADGSAPLVDPDLIKKKGASSAPKELPACFAALVAAEQARGKSR